MLVLAIIALGWGACVLWDRIADPDFNRERGWLVKTGLVIAAIVLVIGPLWGAIERLDDAVTILLGYAAEVVGFLLMALLAVAILLAVLNGLGIIGRKGT